MRILLILFFLSNIIYAQDFSKKSLNSMEDEALLTLFNEVEFDSIRAEKVVRVYLDRARKKKDTIKMARGYDRLARIFHSEKNIQFADSVIHLTKDIKNITYPGIGYILKATEYYVLGNLEKSYINYLQAYDLAKFNRNIAHQVFLSDVLINLKIYWGDKREALELQKKRHQLVTKIDFYEELKKSTRKDAKIDMKNLYLENELYSLSNFILCYTDLKVLDSAQYYLNLSYDKLNKYNGTPSYKRSYAMRLPLSSAEISYYKKDYKTSLDSINMILSKLKIFNSEHKYLKNVYMFKGLNLFELNRKKEGVSYLIKSDSILNINVKSFVPYHRLIYEKLIEYYTDQNDMFNKSKYLLKLKKIDSIILRKYQFFEPNFIKKFENPKIFKEKEELIKELKNENLKSKSFLWVTLGILSSCIIVIVLYQRKQRVYKTRFKDLINNKNVLEKNASEKKLSTEIYKNILLKLDTFEVNRGYLKNELTLNSLAKRIGTNQKYLSKVINIEKEKNFSQYINDLRITYIFNELQTNENLRNFTIKAIAVESGFKNAESFSKAFFKKYKIKPSYYLKQLRKGNAI